MWYASIIAWGFCSAGPTGLVNPDASFNHPAATQPAIVMQQNLKLLEVSSNRTAAAFDAGANLGRWDGSASSTKALQTVRLLTLQVGEKQVGLSLRPIVSVSSPFASGAYLSAQPNDPVGSIRYVPTFDLPPDWELKLDRAIDVAVVVGGAATVGAVVYSLLQR